MPRVVKPYKKRSTTGRTGGRPGGRYARKKRPCPFCVEKGRAIDYKDSVALRRFISEQGKIEPRRRTSACAKHQRLIAQAIKRARVLGTLPSAGGHVRLLGIPEVPQLPQVPAVSHANAGGQTAQTGVVGQAGTSPASQAKTA